MTSMFGPVSDWVTDLDHADPEYNERAHEIWDEPRELPLRILEAA